MTSAKQNKPADFIVPLNMNGLQGRMLNLPAPTKKNKEILFIYGHHSSLERWWGLAEALNRYGAVTIPDLPGFGGMDSFYRIKGRPSVDAMADYLAAFIKMRYKKKKFTLVSMSFGFVVVTRMLQRYPDITKKIDNLVSVAGFTHGDEFLFSKTRYMLYLTASKFFSMRLPALFFKNVVLNPAFIRVGYGRTHNAKAKFKGVNAKDRRALLDFEVYLWHVNDLRTHMYTSAEFLRLNNCKKQVDIELHHVSVEGDQYFDSYRVEQHLNVIFPKVVIHKAKHQTHAPSLMADEVQAAKLFPGTLKRLFNQ